VVFLAEDKSPREAKEKLLLAAAQLFAERGFAGVSIREVATAAGVNSALISYHFGGKEGLYEAVVTAQFERVISRFEKMVATEGTPQEKIKMYADLIRSNHTEDQPLMARLIQGELSSPTSCMENVIKKNVSRMARLVTGIIKEGMDSGAFRNDILPVFAAVSLAGMLNFFFIMREVTKAIIPGSDNQDEAFIEAALSIYLKGMGRE
jgi:TetR/AcrR family transcriptional regulator